MNQVEGTPEKAPTPNNPMLIYAVIAVALIVIFTAMVVNANKSLNSLGAQISDAESKVTKIQEVAEEKQQLLDGIQQITADVSKDPIDDTLPSGLSPIRVENDNEIAKEFFKSMLTWGGYSTYTEIRNGLIARGISETDPLVTDFMPALSEQLLGDANMRFTQITPQVTNIEGDVYSYFAIVKVTTTGSSGGTSSGEVACTYKMNSNGDITGISANI